jgi:uncharacterized glyoxalase superfamily protein PhnB
MTTNLQIVPTAIIPTLRYSDVPRAIDWLCDAFGFERHLLVADDDGDGVVYAELTIGGSMIMVGPTEGSAFGGLMKQPDQIGGAETQICYLHVEDANAHRDRAVAAGAEIVLDFDAAGSPGGGYSCRDPEGHIWNFGTYNPWHTLAAAGHGGRRKHGALLLSSLLLLIPVALGLLFGNPEQVFAERERDSASFAWSEPKQAAAAESDQELRKTLANLRAAKEAGEQALRAVEEQLALERNAHLIADRSLQDTQEQLAKQRMVVASIGSGDRAMSEELERERAARLTVERRVREIDEQLQQLRSATAASERRLQEAQGRLAVAIAAREAAGRPAPEGAGHEVREPLGKRAAAKASFTLQARVARYRAARAASRARLRRMREANAPHIKPPLPFF